MLRAVKVETSAPMATAFSDVVVLDYDTRRRRRIALTARGGLSFLLDLAAAPVLRTGDALVLDDGRRVLVEAAREHLMELRCANSHHLARLAWHIGNRHLAAEILDQSLRIRADHVIGEMAKGLGADVFTVEAPFNPEQGAYHGGPGPHGHDHGA